MSNEADLDGSSKKSDSMKRASHSSTFAKGHSLPTKLRPSLTTSDAPLELRNSLSQSVDSLAHSTRPLLKTMESRSAAIYGANVRSSCDEVLSANTLHEAGTWPPTFFTRWWYRIDPQDGCTIIEMQLIDRFERRITLLTGCIVMSIAMLVCPRFLHLVLANISLISPDQWRPASSISP